MSKVKIDAVSEVLTDKNGRNYKSISLSSGNTIERKDASGQMYTLHCKGQTVSVRVWEKTYLNDTKHWLYDLTKGMFVKGTILTVNVAPYIIEDEENGTTREVSTYTGFVENAEEGDADFDSEIRNMILSAGRELAEDASSNFEVAKEHQSSNEVEELAKESVEEQTDVELEY